MFRNKATLKDVACEAGVSVGTVSKYINGPYSVKEENRINISNAIKKLDFTPNTYAQKLARGKSNTIVVYILSEQNISPSTWLHQLPIIQAINDYLSKKGYALQMEITPAQKQRDLIGLVKKCIDSREADGILMISVWKVHDEVINLMVDTGFPFVLIDNHSSSKKINEVCSDNYRMVKELVSMLAENGHKKIGYINVTSGQQDMKYRFKGYLEGMKENNLQVKDENVLYGDFSIESGYNCVKKILSTSKPFTAIICGNDNMAVGALKAAKAYGLRVPEDISIIGIDNSIVAYACEPRLQTVHFQMDKLGRIAAEILLECINNPQSKAERIIVPHIMIPGESVGKVNE